VQGTETLDHHGSHRDLLWADDSSVPRRGIDAIIVPTARHPAYLAEAATLARALDCTLLTLHSKWTSAAKAAQRLPRSVDLIAVDVPDAAQLRLPDWETSRLLAGTVFARRTDVSAKRNLGLLLSHLLGWSRVLFLDDDIHNLDADDMRRASGLLSTHSAVGLHIGGFPDNSVVCHAYRQAGGCQQSFIGGGALIIEVDRSNSFFPDIYNEDWFFLLDGEKGLQSVALTGEVRQYPYDPFRTPDRARAEELGDVLAEGIYWLLDQGRSITEADTAHWAWFLEKRRRFIRHVLRLVDEEPLDPADKARRVAALKGSLGRLALITPKLCADYLLAWVADRRQWLDHLKILTEDIQQRPLCGEPAALAMLSRPDSPRLTWQLGPRGSRPASKAHRAQRRQPSPLRPNQLVPETGVMHASKTAAPQDAVAAGAPSRT
jgi:hypothetical protein